MSSGGRSAGHSSTILRSRYQDLLKDIVPSKVVDILCDNNLLTQEETQKILSFESDAKQHQELLDTLTWKGIPMLTKYSSAIKNAKRQPDSNLGKVQEQLSHSTEASVPKSPNKPQHECQGFPDTRVSVGSTHVMNGEVGQPPRPPQTGDECIILASPLGGESEQARAIATGDLVGSAPPAHDHHHDAEYSQESQVYRRLLQSQMEAFTVLLFTFFSQLRASIDQQLSLAHSESTSQDTGSVLSSKHARSKNHLSWITLDVDWQSIREYFPAEFVKGVNPSVDHLVPLRLSVLLDAFQQFCQRYMKLVQDNETMQSKLKFLPELMQQKSISEAKLREREIAIQASVSTSLQDSSLQHDVSGKLKRLDSLERAYANVEERCKQLVMVTQQWSAECADKDKLIAVQDKQIEQLTADLDKTQRKLTKYKKHWVATKDAAPKGASDAQFEELRLELACRRELHNQVIAQRDDAEKRLLKLTSENDELKDLIEELRDRLSNYKVQSQAKEPTIREMANVVEENRKLREELEKLRRTCAEQSDKLLAYETYVSDLTSQGEQQLQPRQQAPPTTTAAGPGPINGVSVTGNQSTTNSVPQPKPRRAPSSQQAMVTGGFGIPSHIKREVRNHYPELKLPKQHAHVNNSGDDSKSVLSQSATPIDAPPTEALPTKDPAVPPKNPSLVHRQPSAEKRSLVTDGSDDDSSSVSTLSSTASEDSMSGRGNPTHRPVSAPGQRSKYLSTTNKAAASAKLPPGPSYVPHPTVSPPRCQGNWPCSPGNGGLQFPPRLQNGGASSVFNGGDYTQRVHYPNNSGIIVKPLTDEERSLHCGSSHANSEKSSVKVHNEPIALLPADSSVYDFTVDEKQCPICQHVFLTLTEREFKSHVALCFK